LGKHPYLGVAILLLSFVYFPPVIALLKKMTGFIIPEIVKIIPGLLILRVSLEVGELFDGREVR